MRIVVSGVGTEVGKTWTSTALTLWLRANGKHCIALKPVQSGGAGDSHELAEASGFHVEPSPYWFQEPIGPHLAARRAKMTIDLEHCRKWVDRCSLGFEVTIVELAGGLFSPLSDQHTNADLLKILLPDRWIAVAVDRLGVLHDLSALLMAAHATALCEPTVVLCAPPSPDGSTGTNGDELETVGICRVAASFPRAQPSSPEAQEMVKRLVVALGLL